jgi:hypothetical protein
MRNPYEFNNANEVILDRALHYIPQMPHRCQPEKSLVGPVGLLEIGGWGQLRPHCLFIVLRSEEQGRGEPKETSATRHNG